MKKRVISLVLCLLMVLSLIPTTAFASDIATQGGMPGGDKPSKPEMTSVSHIDIQMALNIPGVNNVQLDRNDMENLNISAKQGGTDVSYTWNRNSYTLNGSTDGQGHQQVRLNGEFPIGTRNNPVEYTITLTKTVNGVPYTLTLTASYWTNNVCPGLKTNQDPGIDVKFGEGQSSGYQVTITKKIEGIDKKDLAGNMKFKFAIKDASGTVVKELEAVTNQGVDTANATTFLKAGTYTVEETSYATYEGYEFKETKYSTENGTLTVTKNSGSITVTNTYAPEKQEPEKTSVTVTKAWVDDNNKFGTRPGSVSVQLLADGSSYGTPVTLNSGNNWTYTWSDLDAQVNGKDVVYTVQETQCSGYDKGVVTGNAKDGFTITNKLQKISVTIEKEVVNSAALPEDAAAKVYTFEIYRDNQLVETVTLKDGESKSVQLAPGAYTIKESSADIPGYLHSITFMVGDQEITDADHVFRFSASQANKVTVKNSYQKDYSAPAYKPAALTVVKKDAVTGAPLSGVTFTLNNKDNSYSETKTTGEDGKVIFTDLLSTELEGYTLKETQAPSGYVGWGEREFEVTVHPASTYKDEYDRDTQKWVRYYDCYIMLDGEKVGSESIPAAGDYDLGGDGFTIPVYSFQNDELTLYNEPVKDIEIDIVKHIDTKYLPTDPSKEQKFVFTVELDNHETLADMFGSSVPSALQVTFNGEVLTGRKGEYTVTLTASSAQDGSGTLKISGTRFDLDQLKVTVYEDEALTIKENETNVLPGEWTYSEDYHGGRLIYNVASQRFDLRKDFAFDDDGEIIGGGSTMVDTPFTFTNEYNYCPTTSIDVAKSWDDMDNKFSLRPESITVQLYTTDANGENLTAVTGKTLTLTAKNSWKGTFADLPQFNKDGSAIYYTVGEETVAHYLPGDVSGEAADGFTITNTLMTGSLVIRKDLTDANGHIRADKDLTFTFDVYAKDADITKDAPVLAGVTVTVKAGDDFAWIEQPVQLPVGDYIVVERTPDTAPSGYTYRFNDITYGAPQAKPDVNALAATDSTAPEFASIVADRITLAVVNNSYDHDPYTVTIPVTKTVTKALNSIDPGKVTFTFKAQLQKADGTWVDLACTNNTITITGTGTKSTEMSVTIPSEYFSVMSPVVTLRIIEVNDGLPNWKYADNACEIKATVKDGAINLEYAGPVAFTNTYSYTYTPPRPKPTPKPIPSVKTGDMGIALYALTSLLSLGGTALVIKKRKDEE